MTSMTTSQSGEPTAPPSPEPDPMPGLSAARTFRDVALAVVRQPAGNIGLAIIVAVVLMAVFAPLLAPYSPTATDTDAILVGPGSKHLLGTDDAGRDVVSRLMFGAQPALVVGTVAVLVGGLVGMALGILAGYYRGAVEALIMRICDVAFAFPLILIGICAVVVLGPGVISVGLAVGIGVTPMFARLARAEVLEEMSRDYVKASRGMGATPLWVVLRHIVPNIATTMVVQMATAISSAIVIASALDFLGMGTQPPAASWGNMLQASRQYLANNPVFAISPGVILTVFVLGVNLFAAALTNALNPRIRTKLLRSRSILARFRSRLDAGPTTTTPAEATIMRETT